MLRKIKDEKKKRKQAKSQSKGQGGRQNVGSTISTMSNSGRKANEASFMGPVVLAPVSESRRLSTRKPRTFQTERGGVRIVHAENLGSINGSVAFTVQSYVVNPGLQNCFPWLSTIAQNYEQYRFHRVSFRYITRTGTSTTGSVLGAPDYDVLDPPPTSEQQISSYQDCVEDVTWRNIDFPLDTSAMFPLGPRKYVRGSEPVFGDLKTYDACQFFLATVEETSSTSVGKLWIDYDVEFFVPASAAPTSGLAPTTSALISNGSTPFVFTNGVGNFLPFILSPLNPLGIVNTDGIQFSIPRGNYKIDTVCSVENSIASAYQYGLQLFKNNAPNSLIVGTESGTASSGGTRQLKGSDTFSSNGTDIFQLLVTPILASGVSSLLGNTLIALVSLL
jgi:hypothetical protein